MPDRTEHQQRVAEKRVHTLGQLTSYTDGSEASVNPSHCRDVEEEGGYGYAPARHEPVLVKS